MRRNTGKPFKALYIALLLLFLYAVTLVMPDSLWPHGL